MGLEKTVGAPLAAALLLGTGLLQAQVPSGDFQVNSYTTGAQHTPRVAVAAGGDFVVVWASAGSPGSDSSYSSIQGQRYALDGSPLGSQFQVNAYTTGAQRSPAVAMADGGDFVVVWTSSGSPGSDTSYSSIQGQRFARDGTPLGGQFQVNSITTYHQRAPAVAVAGSGDFVVVWEVGDYAANVQGQRFTPYGSPAGDEFQIDGFGYGDPSVAIAADSDFVVVWEHTYYYSHLPGQRFAAYGSPVGFELSIGDVAAYELDPAVAAAPDGDFVVVWTSSGFNDDGSTFYDVRGRRFAADGSPLGGRFQVNSTTTGRQQFPSVATTAAGDFAVVWQSDASSGSEISSQTVQGRRFAADGSRLGDELQINSYVPDFLDSPSVALAGAGEVFVAWESDGSDGSDTSSSSIQGRRLRLGGRVPPANDDCASAQPIGNGAVAGDTTGATGDGRGRCASTTGEDVWFRYTAPADAELSIYLTARSTPGHDVAVHAVCPGTPLNEITCRGRFPVAAGDEILFRVARRDGYPEGPFTLVVEPSSTVSGTVTDDQTGAPVPAAEVKIWNQEEYSYVGDAVTDGEGRYTASILRPGTHFVKARAETHRDEVFDDVPCDDDCSPEDVGTPIEVGRNAQITGIDLALERLASISGRVVEATTGAPIADAGVEVAVATGRTVGESTTDPQGEYTVGGLDAGTYFVKVTAAGYFRELYDEVRCPDPDCSTVDPTPIAVADEAAVAGIDFVLEPLGRITGTVTSSTTGQPLPFVQVSVRDEERPTLRSTVWTDDDGEYSVGDLYAGSYLVSTLNFEGWADEIFDDQPCCDRTHATPVPVTAGTTAGGIDFALDPAGVVTGTVTDGRTGAAVSNAEVWIFDSDGFVGDVSSVDHQGRYRLTGLADGTYFAIVTAPGRIPELYDDLPCPGAPFGCDPTAGTPIPAATGTVTAGIDFVLASQGISGRVTDGLTGEPLPFATVWVRDPQGEPVANAGTRFTGSYRLLDLPPGTYRVTASRHDYVEERYDGVACPDGCGPAAGDPVEVTADAVTRNVDFALTALGSISGTVRDAGGAPLRSISVAARNSAGFQARSTPTGRDGAYTLDGLVPDTYVVRTRNQDGYLDELYDDQPCGEDDCDDTAAATPIPIALGTAVAGVDFTLDRAGTLFGTVRDAVTGDPIYASLEVRVWDAGGALAESTSTGGDGTYEVLGLAPGTYFVTTWDAHSDGFIDQLYGGLPCRYGACDPTAGTPVEVGLNRPSAGVDFVLDLEQGISGRVTHDASGLPVFGDVDVWDADGRRVKQLWIQPSGSYVGALPVGTYYLSTRVNSSGPDLADEIYDGIPCSRFGCDPTLGTPVTVTGGAVLRNLDFVLSGRYCERGLCLAGDRFRVSVRWEDFDVAAGSGRPERLTADAGTFWFFGPDNVELVVKVLDACVEPFNHFWVFAAGLTNVATQLVVTDTWTREQRIYVNRLGDAFELIRDTEAFSCELPAAEPAPLEEGAELARQARLELEHRLADLSLPREPGTSAPAIEGPADPIAGAGACVPSATTLCLRDGRFQVESSWRTADGDLGVGQAVPLTADTGTFWFFSPDNVEAIVKVLDACGLPSFRSYWVFAAGLTDVEVTLTVTDTVSGEVREYVNPLGTPFRAIQDTDAFATCP